MTKKEIDISEIYLKKADMIPVPLTFIYADTSETITAYKIIDDEEE